MDRETQMPRFAVLHSLDDRSLPVGLAIERRGYVHIDAMQECGLPARIEEPYHVRQRDLSEIIYRPGDAHYFDQVLIELSRLCTVGEQGSVEDADWGTIDSLLHSRVTSPRIAALGGSYSRVMGPAVVKARAYANPVYKAREACPFVIHGGKVKQHGPDEPAVELQPATRGRHRVAA